MGILDYINQASKSPYLDPRAMAGKGLPNAQSDPRMTAAAAQFIPGVGDAVGLLSDVGMYAQDPSSRTPMNGALSLAALLPGVPSSAQWVNAAGKPIANKALRKALKWLRAEEATSIDDHIAGLARTVDTWGDTVPAKKEAMDALKTLEKHKGDYFPGPKVQQWYGIEPPTRLPGPPKPLQGGNVWPPTLR